MRVQQRRHAPTMSKDFLAFYTHIKINSWSLRAECERRPVIYLVPNLSEKIARLWIYCMWETIKIESSKKCAFNYSHCSCTFTCIAVVIMRDNYCRESEQQAAIIDENSWKFDGKSRRLIECLPWIFAYLIRWHKFDILQKPANLKVNISLWLIVQR